MENTGVSGISKTSFFVEERILRSLNRRTDLQKKRSAPRIARRDLTPQETVEVSERIQHSFLIALMRSRHWQRGEVAFQGGACLHLIYGSPRFSQDLDFMVTSDKSLDSLTKSAAEAAALEFGAGPDWTWRVATRGDEEDDNRNPRMYHLVVQAPHWTRAIKIRAEFYVVSQEDLRDYETKPMVSPLTNLAQPQAMVDVATVQELVADKIFAIAARPYVKARDWFDLWWIHQAFPEASTENMAKWSAERMRVRSSMYPAGPTEDEVLAKLMERMASFNTRRKEFKEDLHGWLIGHPSLQGHAAVLVSQAHQTVRGIAKQLELLGR